MNVQFINTSPLGENKPQEKRLFIGNDQDGVVEEPEKPPRPATIID